MHTAAIYGEMMLLFQWTLYSEEPILESHFWHLMKNLITYTILRVSKLSFDFSALADLQGGKKVFPALWRRVVVLK